MAEPLIHLPRKKGVKTMLRTIYCIFIIIASIQVTVPTVQAAGPVLPGIDLNGNFRAISWVYSHLGEKISKQRDLNLQLSYSDGTFKLNSYPYTVDNVIHTLPHTETDQYKAFWTDGGNVLVIEIYVSEDGTFKKDKDGNPKKSVQKYYYSPDKKYLFWETEYPHGMTLIRKYERLP